MNFAQRVHQAVEAAQAQDELRLSRAQVEAALAPLLFDLWGMPIEEAKAYIRESFRHEGYQALAVHMYKVGSDAVYRQELLDRQAAHESRSNGQPLDT